MNNALFGEFMGTLVLILLGNGVVANVLLNKSKGQNGGWIVITTGWALGVAVAVYSIRGLSDAHISPAVTIGLAVIGKFAWANVPGYVLAQMIGGFLGGIIVWLAYLAHWGITEDKSRVHGVFFTAPAIHHSPSN